MPDTTAKRPGRNEILGRPEDNRRNANAGVKLAQQIEPAKLSECD